MPPLNPLSISPVREHCMCTAKDKPDSLDENHNKVCLVNINWCLVPTLRVPSCILKLVYSRLFSYSHEGCWERWGDGVLSRSACACSVQVISLGLGRRSGQHTSSKYSEVLRMELGIKRSTAPLFLDSEHIALLLKIDTAVRRCLVVWDLFVSFSVPPSFHLVVHQLPRWLSGRSKASSSRAGNMVIRPAFPDRVKQGA